MGKNLKIAQKRFGCFTDLESKKVFWQVDSNLGLFNASEVIFRRNGKIWCHCNSEPIGAKKSQN